MNDVEQLIEEIKAKAAEKGLFLHRYQSNYSRHAVSVVYAIDSREQKPARAIMCDGAAVLMQQLEGKTKKCEAYRELSELLENI